MPTEPRVHDSRRLTGPHLYTDRPGAVLDVELDASQIEAFGEAWLACARRLLEQLGWGDEPAHVHPHAGGLSCVIEAPIDCLYAATEVGEQAFEAARAELDASHAFDEAAALSALRTSIETERRPALRAFVEAARERRAPWLVDDDLVSIGHGAHVHTWASAQSPEISVLDELDARPVPIALVTGTNGKSTTVRMLSSIARAAGLVPGVTSTDWVKVGDELLDRGDYSGPGGARTVLRHPRTEVAVLETARGGLYRRGLAVERADVACVLNVAADHLGEWGAWSVDDLADVKLTVGKAIDATGRVVLNAEDERVRTRGLALDRPLAWFATASSPFLDERIARGEPVAVLRGNELVSHEGGEATVVTSTAGVPSTFDGAARFNVANALAAVAVARGLGIAHPAIAEGLRTFGADPEDNPGRHVPFDLGGVRAIVDFAHNPHGQRAVLELAAALPAQRRLVVLGQAGDRDDASVRELVEITWSFRPDLVLVKDMPRYLRGREPGEMVALIDAELEHAGAPSDRVERGGTEFECVRRALQWSRPGDLLLLFAHAERERTLTFLRTLAASGWRPGDSLPAEA